MKKNLLIYENLHIPFWLVKDICWAMEFKPLALVMVFPTFILSLLIVYRTRQTLVFMLPNVAISFWILANSVWMFTEFYAEGLHWLCYVPFGLGLVVIFYWLFFYFPNLWKEG